MDNSKVTVNLNGQFTANEMEEIIREFAKVRAGMQPEVPRTIVGAAVIDAESLIEDASDFQFATTIDGGLRIHLRSSGLGWLAFNLTASQRAGLMTLLSDQVTDTHHAH